MRDTVPPAELFGQVFLMHTVSIGGHDVVLQIHDIFLLRHRTHPILFFGVIPRVPIHFIIAEGGSCRHGQTDPIRFHLILDPLERALHIFRCDRVLRFKILMKNADAFIRIMCLLKIKHQIEQQTTVFTAGK